MGGRSLTILKGCDSAMGPSLASARAAKADGVDWWEVYVGGPNATHAWSAGEAAILREVGITPVAIWVPSYSLDEDPIQAAADAVGAMEERGIWGALMLDTEERMKAAAKLRPFVDAWCAHVPRPSVYAGAGYVPDHAAPVWLDWGGSALPELGHATQYGPAAAYGMAVDRDLADDGFPLGSWSAPSHPGASATVPPSSSSQPTEEPALSTTFVTVAASKYDPGLETGPVYPHVAEGSVWIVSGLQRSWVASAGDTKELLEQYGQTALRSLSGATIARIPVAT